MRVRVDYEMADAKLRLAGFMVVNQFLATSDSLRRALDLDPEDLLIVLTVALGTVQRLMRSPDPDGLAIAPSWLDIDQIVPVSRRAVARATNLPRETARRRVADLIKRGILTELDGGLRSAQRLVLDPDVRLAIHEMLERLAGTCRLLAKEGVLIG